ATRQTESAKGFPTRRGKPEPPARPAWSTRTVSTWPTPGPENTWPSKWNATCSKIPTSKPRATSHRPPDSLDEKKGTRAKFHAMKLGPGVFISIRRCRAFHVVDAGVSDVRALDHVDQEFGHVLGMVTNAFQGFGDEEQFD